MKPKKNIMHLPVYQPGKSLDEVKKELGLTEIIKLASNENPYGCSSKVKQAVIEEVDNTNLYPDGAGIVLTKALSQFLDVEPNQIILGAGSDDVILMIARAFLVAGDETIMATHTFPQYKHNAEIEGAVCVEVPLINGTHDLTGMLSKISDVTKIVWICNPNNPTGTMLTHDEISSFLAKAPEDVLVVLDEAYVEYNVSSEYPRSLELIAQYKNVILLRTFSKIYGMASLRIGYGIGHPDVIKIINQVREPFNTTRFAQTAATAAIQDQAFVKQCRDANQMGLEYLSKEFSRLGLSYYPTYGNFIMVDVEQPAEKIFQLLMSKGIIVRGGHALGFPTSIRVTIGSEEQNEKFIRALKQSLKEITVNVN